MELLYLFILTIVHAILGTVTYCLNVDKGYKGGFMWGFFLGVIGIIVVGCRPYNPAMLSKMNTPTSPSVAPALNPQKKETSEEDVIRSLKEYKSLLDSGVITEDEFEKKKSELLSGRSSPKKEVTTKNISLKRCDNCNAMINTNPCPKCGYNNR